MFIKRDLRKIDEILVDTSDSREIMKLSNRKAEFEGSIRILCRESRIPSLKNLLTLNLYGNDIVDLQGIGALSQTPIREMNLGNNKISSVPLEFGSLQTLKTLWLEDNELDSFPMSLCQLGNLTSLRLSGNNLTYLPTTISALYYLEALYIDNNKLAEFPKGLLGLSNLKELWLRQNKLDDLPEEICELSNLQVLSVSSNLLGELPFSLGQMASLRKIFANGNKVSYVPAELCTLAGLETINLANNRLDHVPAGWTDVWGDYNPTTGMLSVSSSGPTVGGSARIKNISINLLGNPIVVVDSSSIKSIQHESP